LNPKVEPSIRAAIRPIHPSFPLFIGIGFLLLFATPVGAISFPAT